MTLGVRFDSTPANADNSGLYLVLRDEVTKAQSSVYVRNHHEGIHLKPRQKITVHNYEFTLEFERPYRSLDLEISGVKFRDLCNIEYDGHLAITANHGCVYFRDGNACKFCSIPEWRDSRDVSLNMLVEAVSRAIELHEVKHISFTSGTTSSFDRGIRSILNIIKRIKNIATIDTYPLWAEFEPPEDMCFLDALKDAGVETVSCNIEFLQPSVRLELMPGKGNINIDSYIQCWERCINLFGRNQVFSNVLLVPEDFEEPGNNGWDLAETMIELGIIPSFGVLYFDPNSELSAARPISARDHFSTLITYARKLHQAELNPGYAKAGCHRNGAYSALNEAFVAYKQEWL